MSLFDDAKAALEDLKTAAQSVVATADRIVEHLRGQENQPEAQTPPTSAEIDAHLSQSQPSPITPGEGAPPEAPGEGSPAADPTVTGTTEDGTTQSGSGTDSDTSPPPGTSSDQSTSETPGEADNTEHAHLPG